MDIKYALQDMKEFQDILQKYENLRFYIFTGHYHVEKTILHHNMRVFITPSCFVQIGQDSASFQPDHYNIGYRIIDIGVKGDVRTHVRYL